MIKNLNLKDKLKKLIKKGKKFILAGAIGLGLTACANEPSYNNNDKTYEYSNDNYDDYSNNNDYYYNDDKYYSNELDDLYTESTLEEEIKNEISMDITFDDLLESEQQEEINNEITYDDAIIESINNSQVKLDENDVYNIKSTIDSINVNYLYSEYFEVDEAMKLYNSTKLNSTSQQLEIINNNKIDADVLYNKVKNNNLEYKNKYANVTKYENPSESELKDICNWISESSNKELEKGIININALEEKLQNLKIFNVTDFTYGSYSSDEGMISYNKSTINTLNKENAFQETIWHETKHLIQSASNSQKEGTQIKSNYGVCYEFSGLKVNSLNPNWLFEGTAEKLTLNQMGINESVNYEEFIKSLDMLTMTNITKHNIGELENICMQSDLNKLYEYFGATTNEEKKEVSTMLYAYNIILNDSYFSSSIDFYNNYKEKEGQSVDSKTEYQYSLSSSISQTLSKLFYKNLADLLNNKEINMSEVFKLISNFEISLSNQSRYSDTRRIDAMQDFFNNYNIIQQEFFEQIANKLGVQTSDILGAYQSYYKQKDNSNNVKIISEDNNKFMNDIYEKYEYYKQGTVYEISQNYVKGYKK